MSPRRIRTLTFALIAGLGAQLAAAQAPDETRLKLERQLHMAPPRPDRDSVKFLEADRIQGEQDRNIVATGDVTLRQRGAVIRADRVEYFGDEQRAVATGRVRLERQGDTATGPRLDYRLDNDTGEMPTPLFEFVKTPERRIATRGQAERAVMGEEHRNHLYQAEYTSCPAPRDDWFLRVRELEIDSDRNVGRAYNSTVYFLGLPILYSPFISFALDNKRRSGFLAPTFGTSGKSGFEVSLPYYWNIAQNLDATLTPKVFTKRGVQMGGEFRYLYPKFNGVFESEFLPHDRIAERDRYFVALQHAQQLWGGWHAAINAQKVSDDNYFRDLSTKIASTSQTSLPRDAIVAYDDDVWSLSARALAYQTLQDPAHTVPIPYRILPRLVVAGQQQNVRGFDWQLYSEASSFDHPTLVNGQRAIIYPSLAFPMRTSYGYVTPRFGFHMTRYHVGDNNTAGLEDATRSLPISSIDAGLYLDRDTAWGGRAFQQTLEPRLYYLNVPFRDQSNLPNFTTAEKDFNYSQLFTDNRFVGGDRIGDANQLTLALASRLIETETGLERFRAALGQVYYFRPPRVTLAGSLPQSDTKSPDLIAFASSQMAPSVAVDASWQYTPNLSRSQRVTLAAHYTPVPGSIVNAAYRYVRTSPDSADPANDGIKQVDVSTQWPLTRNISALARYDWSVKDRKLLEGLVGFEYNAGCWQVRAIAHRFITATQQYSTSLQIQLELTGLSRIGINPLETIRQNISGYRRSDEIAP